MEGPGTPANHRSREREGGPLPAAELRPWNHRERDDRHGQQATHPQAAQGAGGRSLRVAGRDVGADDCGRIQRTARGVAGLLDRRDKGIHVDGLGRTDGGLRRRHVDRSGHTFEPVEPLLDTRCTRGTGHAPDVEVDTVLARRECSRGRRSGGHRSASEPACTAKKAGRGLIELCSRRWKAGRARTRAAECATSPGHRCSRCPAPARRRRPVHAGFAARSSRAARRRHCR